MRRVCTGILVVLVVLAGYPSLPTLAEGTAQTCDDYVYNGSFAADLGLAGWSHGQADGTVYTSENYFDPPYSIRMGGQDDADDWLWQMIQLPDNTVSVVLMFSFAGSSSDSYPQSDFFYAGLADSGLQNWLIPPIEIENTSPEFDGGWWSYETNEEPFAAYAGSSIALMFHQTTDYSLPTTVYVDYVMLFVCTESTPGTPTRTPTAPPMATSTATHIVTATRTTTPHPTEDRLHVWLPIIAFVPTSTPTVTWTPVPTPTSTFTPTASPTRSDPRH